jgi:F0F1-type ATP synthase membrane subunit a
MNWLIWVLIAIVVVVLISKLGKKKNNKLSNSQAAILANALISTFDDILTNLLGDRFSHADRRKIAMGMVAVMATENISLDRMTKDPDLVVLVAAKSAAMLAQCGEISI